MKFIVLGAGSIGGLLISKLALGGNLVEVIVNKRSSKRHIESEGLEYFYRDKKYVVKVPCYVYEDLKEIETDYLILATKSHDALRIMEEIKLRKFFFNYFVTVQNGIEPHQKASEIFGEDHLILSIREGVYSFDLHKVRHTSDGTIMNVVTSFKASRESMEHFAEILTKAGLPAEISLEGLQVLYEKLIYNSIINPLASILRVKNGFLLKLMNSTTFNNLLSEALKVADLQGLHFNSYEVLENLRKLLQATYENKCSMLQDLEQKKKTEIEYLNGYLVKIGRKHQIELPSHQMVYDLICRLEEINGTH